MELLEELQHYKYKLEELNKQKETIQDEIDHIDIDLTTYDRQLKGVVEARQYYKKAIDIVYERSIQELKDVINSALSYIFKDKNLTIDVQLSDKRGKSLTFVIQNNGRRVSLKHGMGMGVKCVISCILHIYYLQCKNSKILMLDEAYSNISKEYIASFFEFIGKLCEKLDFVIILITHDERFIEYADRVYTISNGYVSLTKDTE